ncbi:endolytic transglycosylase MltG [Daejeonella sp. JGW-45]|uniref:endolytic transglycosylase MltG n=1 Tax=Daejeonella sp. JGW-45 TaxID=3034148 RepID=UPI0023ED467E|nr:endolytic transglycosylase MltG [Daejeonella sp. JGW-45]
MATSKTNKLSFKSKIFIVLGILFLIMLAGTAFNYYMKYFGPNVTDNTNYLYIRTGSDFDDVYESIRKDEVVKDSISFRNAADNMDYPGKVKPGKYRLTKGMSNRSFINMLKAGNQEPVKIAFQNVRLKETLAGMVSKKIETDSASISHLLDSAAFVGKYGFNTDNVYTMFIPNSYEIYWNTSAEKFFTRMYDEYNKFWTQERKARAEKIELSPINVSILASIVDGEALMDKEMPVIAGLYINRLKKGMKLEADPTVIFAAKDFTIRRVLNKHLRISSSYNTYMYKGLPPGPIGMPSISAIDAVLNYANHDYLYMCAKEDFSGYHNFATNLAQHTINARKFQQALNERNIKK